MPEKTCPYCGEAFDAASESTESCRKAACVKANQRAKKRAAAGVTEVKRGRPKKAPDVQDAEKSAVEVSATVPPAADVNALARNVILSRVKTKMPQEDPVEDRLKRLDQAMKQFAPKKKAPPKGGES